MTRGNKRIATIVAWAREHQNVNPIMGEQLIACNLGGSQAGFFH